MFFDMMDIGGHRIVVVDVADAMEMHLVMAARTNHMIAMNHPAQPLVKRDPAVSAANVDFMMLDLMGVRIGHGRRPFAMTMGQKSCR
ncbi:MAG: hypothetical protein WA776_21760 [Xanthobacteraceae bacterium]